jgi:hypothetical protein
MGFNRVPTAAARHSHQRRQEALGQALNGPMGFWDKVFGGHLSRELEAAYRTPPQEVGMTTMQKLRSALLEWTAEGAQLEQAVRRWRPDPRNPGKTLSGDDLDAHPPEHRNRKLKEAQAALRTHDAKAATVIDPLVAEVEKEPLAKLQLGTKLGATDIGEVTLLVQQYQNLSRLQQAELQTLGLAALERGDLTAALQHHRAARTLHVQTPELDAGLAEKDPARKDSKAQLDVLRSWVEAAQADVARRHVMAGIADGTEQIGHLTWAQQHGFDPEGSSSYVQAVVGGTSGE